MIFTECPYCDEPQSFGWECGDGSGYFPSRCHNCAKVMWVEATIFDGKTRTHEEFKAEIMQFGDEPEIEAAASNATNKSTVVYDG